jgi:hypothetical protein
MKFKQGNYYLLEDGTIGQAHYTGHFWCVDMTLFRTKEQLENEELDTTYLEEPKFACKGKEFFGNGDFYPIGEGRVVKKLKKLTLKMQQG